jgi:hypothetical protein
MEYHYQEENMGTSLVGSLPGAANRRVIRSIPNPLDKATVISIYPRNIREVKPTIEPGIFVIPAGTLAKPSLTIIGPSSWWREIDEFQPALEIPTSAIEVANSIVKDFSNGLLGCDMGSKMPGIFFVPGEIKEVKQIPADLLTGAAERQRNWYKELVETGDLLWARSQGNPLSISDDMRLAAQELQIKEKPWLKDYNTLQLTNCPACGALRNGEFPICQHCRTVVDVDKFKAAGFKQLPA